MNKNNITVSRSQYYTRNSTKYLGLNITVGTQPSRSQY